MIQERQRYKETIKANKEEQKRRLEEQRARIDAEIEELR